MAEIKDIQKLLLKYGFNLTNLSEDEKWTKTVDVEFKEAYIDYLFNKESYSEQELTERNIYLFDLFNELHDIKLDAEVSPEMAKKEQIIINKQNEIERLNEILKERIRIDNETKKLKELKIKEEQEIKDNQDRMKAQIETDKIEKENKIIEFLDYALKVQGRVHYKQLIEIGIYQSKTLFTWQNYSFKKNNFSNYYEIKKK